MFRKNQTNVKQQQLRINYWREEKKNFIMRMTRHDTLRYETTTHKSNSRWSDARATAKTKRQWRDFYIKIFTTRLEYISAQRLFDFIQHDFKVLLLVFLFCFIKKKLHQNGRRLRWWYYRIFVLRRWCAVISENCIPKCGAAGNFQIHWRTQNDSVVFIVCVSENILSKSIIIQKSRAVEYMCACACSLFTLILIHAIQEFCKLPYSE